MNRRHTHQTGVPLFLKTRQRLNSISIGEPDPDGGVAEIVAYNQDRQQAYVVNGKDGLLYRLDVSAEGLTLAGSEDLRNLVEGVTYLVTANEGDSREWGEEGSEYANEKKVTLTPSDALNGEETPPESAQQNQDVSNPSPVIGLVLVAVLAAVLCGLAVYKAKKTKEK